MRTPGAHPDTGAPLQRLVSFHNNPQMSGPIPGFVYESVLDFDEGPNGLTVNTGNTSLQCPAVADLPPIPEAAALRQQFLDQAFLLGCVMDGEQTNISTARNDLPTWCNPPLPVMWYLRSWNTNFSSAHFANYATMLTEVIEIL